MNYITDPYVQKICDAADKYVCLICGAGIEDECDAGKHEGAKMIKRYELHDTYRALGESEAGDYVRYDDHLAEVAELRAKLATVEKDTIERCAKECDSLVVGRTYYIIIDEYLKHAASNIRALAEGE